MSETAIIVEIGYLKSRFAFHTDSDVHVVDIEPDEDDHKTYKPKFQQLMTHVYQTLGVSNPAAHPVLVLEQDDSNSWRRVSQAEVLMGEHKVPWMYTMWHSLIVAYGHDKGSGSAVVYHLDGDGIAITPVIGGWPHTLGYGNYHRSGSPTPLAELPIQDRYVEDGKFFGERAPLKRNADNVFWVTVACPAADRPALLDQIILSGEGWDDKIVRGEEDFAEMEERIYIQRLQWSHVPRIVRLDHPYYLVPFRAGQKLINDGILHSMDLAFRQSHYTDKGAEYIRQWVF